MTFLVIDPTFPSPTGCPSILVMGIICLLLAAKKTSSADLRSETATEDSVIGKSKFCRRNFLVMPGRISELGVRILLSLTIKTFEVAPS